MDERLRDLYTFPEGITERDIYLEDLAVQCAVLKERVREVIEKLPPEQGQLIEVYMDYMEELEFQSVKKALRIGKKMKTVGDIKTG